MAEIVINLTDFDKKKVLLKEWKKKCGIQALIAGRSSNYYSILDLLFGVPPIVMVSIIGIIEGYNGVNNDPERFFLTKLILSPMAALLKSIHFQCAFSKMSSDFKNAYNDYTSIKRDIDLYETMGMSESELTNKIVEMKKRIENIKKSSPCAPWIITRKFDETKELLQMETIAEQLE